MRNEACRQWIDLNGTHDFVFLTGDLGFNALEPLRDAMGDRFMNAGIAEQNMVSVAAGLSSQGVDAWVYSIAPFCYARPFEQIRNDVCLHGFPVKLVGNGGGYAYGPMGATHHALEDYGSLLTLQRLRAYVPAFSDDLASMIPALARAEHPAYLRLGRCEKPDGFRLPAYASWRKLLSGDGPVVLVVGPLVGGLLGAYASANDTERPNLWVASELPISEDSLPTEFVEDLERQGRLCVAEEHVAHGSAGHMLAHAVLLRGVRLAAFVHVCARGYPSGTYGSQSFHRRECGLSAEQLVATIQQMRPAK